MHAVLSTPAMHPRLLEALYRDALVLADEARHYCEHQSKIDLAELDPVTGVLFSCESLRMTTRLTHLLAWVLNWRGVLAGEPSATDTQRLVPVTETAADVRPRLPDFARALIVISEALYRRAEALDCALRADIDMPSPARALQQRLALQLR